MRILLTSAALIAGGLFLGLGAGTANSGPLPAMTLLSADMTGVETVGWRRRYWRRHGVWPSGPRGAGDAIVVAPGGTVVVGPVRPASCGEFHYWNGVACVDARYNDPSLGPK